MKFLLLTMILISSSKVLAGYDLLFNDQDFACTALDTGMLTKPLYDDIYIIEVRKSGLSKIKYKRKYQGATDYGPLYIIRGCYHAKQIEGTETISVKCLSDGEEGSAFIDPKTMMGELHFYYPKIGYPERSGFNIKCKKI